MGDASKNVVELHGKVSQSGGQVTRTGDLSEDFQTSIRVTAAQLGSADGLTRWLEERMPGGGADILRWNGARGTKRVANLWTELVQGEIELEDGHPPQRTVHVASVRIRNQAGKLLVESHQEMGDGRIRPRNRPLSEKMRPSETAAEACVRGILEELGPELGRREHVKLLEHTYTVAREERDSFSYPGLTSQYILHSMDALMDGLPAVGFVTEENEEPGGTGTGSGSEGNGNGSIAGDGASEGDHVHDQLGMIHGGQLTPGVDEDFSNSQAVGVRKHFWIWVTEEEYAKLVG